MYRCQECGVVCKSVYDLLVSERNCPMEEDACPTAREIEKKLAPILGAVELPNAQLKGK